MKQIALASVNLNAVNPMTEYLSANQEIHVVNYLDSYLLEKVRKDGRVTSDCMRRMVTMLSHACEDGADGIIITCTIFSAYVKYFQELFPVPIVAADAAMMEKAGQSAGRTAMLCTFEGTLKGSSDLLKNCLDKYGKAYELKSYVLQDAYDAAQKCHLKEHDRMIREKILEIEKDFDTIVLAQISMAGAAKDLEPSHARVYTSPSAACEMLLEKM